METAANEAFVYIYLWSEKCSFNITAWSMISAPKTISAESGFIFFYFSDEYFGIVEYLGHHYVQKSS